MKSCAGIVRNRGLSNFSRRFSNAPNFLLLPLFHIFSPKQNNDTQTGRTQNQSIIISAPDPTATPNTITDKNRMSSSESDLDYGNDESGSSVSSSEEEDSSDEEEVEDPPSPSKVYDTIQDVFECPQVQEETNKYGCGTALVHDVKTGSVTKLALFENNVTKDRLKLVCSWCKAMLQISSWDCHFKKCYARQQLLKRQQKMDEERKKIKAKKKRKREQQKKEAKKKEAKRKVSKPTNKCAALCLHTR